MFKFNPLSGEFDVVATPGGSGTVTSVSFAGDGTIFNPATQTVTTTGTFTPVLLSQSANLFLASPNGSSGTPTYRAIVAADLPSLSGLYLPLTGGLMNGTINMQGNTLIGLPTPVNPNDAVNLAYLSNYLPLAGSAKQIIFYSNAGSATSDANHTIDSVTGEVNLQWIPEPNVTSQMLLSGLVTPYGTLPGSWNVTSNSVTNDIAFTGSGDLSAIGGSTESVVIAHVNAATSDLAVVLVDNNGTPSVIMQTLLGASPANGLKYIQDNTQIAIQDNAAGGQWFLLDTANFLYQFGDINNSHQHTYLSIDDQLRTFTFNFDINSYTFPYGDATIAGQSMVSDAAGVLSWAGPFATVASLAAYLPLAGGTMTGTLTLNPAVQLNSNDAASIGQLAGFLSGLTWKSPAVQAADPGNVVVASPVTDFFDGHQVFPGESVLLFNQSLLTENGIYIFNGIGVPMTRRSDANTSALLTAATVSILNGTLYHGQSYTQITDMPIIGVSPVVFTEIGILYQASGGVTLVGHVFTLLLDGPTLIQSGTGVKVADHQITIQQLDAVLTSGAGIHTWPNFTVTADGRLTVVGENVPPITNLGGITASSQGLTNGTAGNVPNWTISGINHVLNIPDASPTVGRRGLVTSADQSFGGNKDFNVTVTSNVISNVGPLLSYLNVNLTAGSTGNTYLNLATNASINEDFDHSLDNLFGGQIMATYQGITATLGNMFGLQIVATGNNTGTINSVVGNDINVSALGAVGSAVGNQVTVSNSGSALFGTVVGVKSSIQNIGGGSTMTNAYGFESTIANSGTSISAGYNYYAGTNSASTAYAFYGINHASRFGGIEIDNATSLKFFNGAGNFVGFKPATSGVTNGTYTWPNAIPGVTSVLESSAAGVLSWANVNTSFVTTFQTFSVQTNFTNVFTFSPSAPTSGPITQVWTVKSQNANTIWAGPTSGGSAAPTFRTQVLADLPFLTNGHLYIGSTGVAPVSATLTGGNAIQITNGAGSITIDALDASPTQDGTVSTNTQSFAGVKTFTQGAAMGSGYGVQFYEPTNSFYVTIQANPILGNLVSDFTYYLPYVAPISGQIMSSDGFGNLTWINAGGLTSGGTATGFAANEIVFVDPTGLLIASDSTFTHQANTFTNITQTSAGNTTAYNQSTVQILLAAENGGTTAAQMFLHNSQGAALTWFDTVGSKNFGFKASDTGAQIQVGASSYYTIPASDGTAGQVLTTAGGFGGLSWTTVAGGGGITTLNTLTATTQTFAIGTTGTDFNIVSATSTHTFNLPTASALNRGALSSADWTTFNNKLSTTGGTMTGAFIEAPVAVTTGATMTVTATLGNTFDIPLTVPTTTLVFAGAFDGQMIRLRIKQDATGGRLISWPGNVKFGTDIPSSSTLSTGANVTDYVGLMYKAATSTYDVVSWVRGF